MELVGERPVWSMSGGEMLCTLDEVDADIARRQTYRLQLIAGLDQIGHAQDIGAHNTAQLLAFRYRLDPPQARRDLRLAVALPKYTDVAAALPTTDPAAGDGPAVAEGFLRPAQAEAIVSALERVPATVPVEDLEVAEQQLVNLARHLSPGELRKAGQRIRDILDTEGPEPDEQKAYDRESLTLLNADRGVKFRGYLANENAELLRSLIHAGARPHKTLDGELDPRPREKRQADALTTALTLAAKATDTTLPAAKPTPTTAADIATAITDADTAATDARTTAADSGATAATTERDAATGAPTAAAATDTDAGTTAAGSGTTAAATAGDARTVAPTATPATGRRSRVADPVPGHGAKATITVTIDLQDLKAATADATGDLVYGGGLSAAAIRRLACDAKIIPLVLGSNSEPLDVGRSERLVTRAMRRALNARDKGCVVCGAPPIQCDAHHLRSWIDGGETSIWNLVLLCRRHHIDLHAGHWTITITNGVVHIARPTWADPPPHAIRQGSAVARNRAQPTQQPAPRPDPNLNRGTPPSPKTTPPPAPGPCPRPAPEGGARPAFGFGSPEDDGLDPVPSSREAASLAIWGEAPAPPAPRSSPRNIPAHDEHPFDPWCEAVAT